MLNFTPVLSRLKAKFRPPSPLLDRAVEVVELEPGSTIEVAPPISLPGEFDRVKAFNGDATLQSRRLTETKRTERPTVSYRFNNALLADFTFYYPGGYAVYRPGGKRPVLAGKPRHFDEAQLCTTSCAETYFGHFLREALPLEMLAHERGLPPLSFAHRPWLHEAGYRDLVGMTPVRTRYARVEKLWLVDETALNDGWAQRIRELRRRIREHVTPTGNENVFLMRGSMGAARNLVNERLLAEELERRGFRIVEPERMEPQALCAALAGAKVISCVEGSAHNHAHMAMPTGAALLSIQPPNRFNLVAKLVADAIGARFAYVVGEPRDGGFYLDPARFMRTLELVS